MTLIIFGRSGALLPFFEMVAYSYLPMTDDDGPLRIKVRLLCVCHVNRARTRASKETVFCLN